MKMPAIALLLVASTALHAGETINSAPATADASPAAKASATRPGTNAEELSDDFLGDVADGSEPAADGTVAEEESGDTLDQTLRAHTRSTP
ncbi:MAG: hypothetical protein ACLGG1_08595 [Gammaproteobacteria bacterium]